MPVGEPFIPRDITVHLGRPEETANNVTVSFPDYIKNVVSSEIFPTWPENALRANIYAAVTFALNRIYTEWYRSRGYDFDITNSTQFDQAFAHHRILHAVCAVQIPGIAGTARTAARLMIRQIRTGTRVVRLLRLPGHQPVFHIDFPAA